jgi:hypothetical protein
VEIALVKGVDRRLERRGPPVTHRNFPVSVRSRFKHLAQYDRGLATMSGPGQGGVCWHLHGP